MNIPKSITDYKTYVENTPQAIRDTCRAQEGVSAARKRLDESHRVFFAGSGSSIPAALLGAQLLTRHTEKMGIFAPSSMLLDTIHLTEHDTIVLVSQGWNRADAALITHKVLQEKAHLIVVTGHPERGSNYNLDENRVTIVPIFPTIEKIFCRPATAVTGYIKITQLVERLIGITYTENQWLKAYEEGIKTPPSSLKANKQYVILASSLLLCSGNNIALSLREGAGYYGTMQEIESYGHGVYVPDQTHKDTTRYIVLTTNDAYYKSAVRRIQPMIETAHSNCEVWSAPDDAVLANVTFMGRIAGTVLMSIERNGWDMNNPPGMEENRSFHEVGIQS
jgi:glucosamine 6-phosphate synthetase-like amidotransferase/phosphosugar isomerase protein